MAESTDHRKLAAILCADVKGYSKLMGEDESYTVGALKERRKLFAENIQNRGGRVVNAPGDSILAEFPSVVSAVQCAVEIQNQLNDRNADLPDDRKMAFRIGVNLGDVIQSEDAIYGDGVNIAARIEALADPGGVSISRTVFNHIQKKLPYGFEYQGEHQVKNINNPVKVYKLLTDPEDAGKLVGMEPTVSAGKWIWPTAVVAAVIVALIGYHVFQEITGPKFEPASVEKMAYDLPDKPSIAVLPFDNMSGDPDQIYIADGISENIISSLSKIPELFVISRNSTFNYKGKPVAVRQIAEDLGVRYVLEGSVQRSGERLRVTAQLIDALKGYHVWSEKYDRKLDHFFIVQDDIALNIAVSLQVKLTEGEQARVRHSTENLEAWALAVEAHGLFETYTRENIAKARELFMKAVELDPDYAYAWTYLGWTYWIDGAYHSAHYDREKCFENASKMLTRAMDVDPKSSDAHALLGSIYLSQKKFDEAETFGRKTIDLDPNSSENHAIVAITMQNIGEFEEAIALLKQAMRLDPYFPEWYLARLGMCYQMIGMYEESVEAFDELAKRYRKSKAATPWDRFYLYLGATYSMMGRLEDAQDCVSKALEYNPKLTVELWRARLQYKNPEHTERILGALRNAGLPENPPLSLPDKPSIAVLPFDNMSGDPDQIYIADGISENIIASLSKIPELFVISRNSTFKYKGKPVEVRQIAKELGVRYVLEGSIQKSGERLRVTAQLIDALKGYHVWSEKYDRKLQDLFIVQDDITLKIVVAMQVELTEGEQAQVRHQTENLQAWSLAVKAHGHFETYRKDDNAKARELFERSIKLDPRYAYAWTYLGWTYWIDAVYYHMYYNRKEWLENAEKMAQTALMIDDKFSDAYALLSGVYLAQGKHDDAVIAGHKAVSLDPNSSENHAIVAITMQNVGDGEAVVALINQAMRLDPYFPPWYWYRLGIGYRLLGRYEESVAALKKRVDIAEKANKPNFGIYLSLATTYSMMGRLEEARAAVSKALEVNPKTTLETWCKSQLYNDPKEVGKIRNALSNAGLQ